jgi:hypothetical protein
VISPSATGHRQDQSTDTASYRSSNNVWFTVSDNYARKLAGFKTRAGHYRSRNSK